MYERLVFRIYTQSRVRGSVKIEVRIWFKIVINAYTQPETRKLQQVCYHQTEIRMRSHRLLRLDYNKSVTSC